MLISDNLTIINIDCHIFISSKNGDNVKYCKTPTTILKNVCILHFFVILQIINLQQQICNLQQLLTVNKNGIKKFLQHFYNIFIAIIMKIMWKIM